MLRYRRILLNERNISFEIVDYSNADGKYKAYTVVKTDPEPGQKVKMNDTVVKVYVATEPPASSSSEQTPPPTSSSQIPETSSSQVTTDGT